MSRTRGRTIPLRAERHGYGVMQCVEELTKSRIVLGAGTVHTSLGKLEADRRAPGGRLESAGLAAVERSREGLIVGYLWAGLGLAVAVALAIGLGHVDFHRRASKQEGANPELAQAAHDVQRQIDQAKNIRRGVF